GPQAAFGELGKSSGRQGIAAADDAARQAQRLGLGPRTPIYYDMEGYQPGQSTRALQFLSAWTTRLHALGYSSGVYSSALSGIADLAHQYGRGRYAVPDVIFDARWNGLANPDDPVLPSGDWVNRRVHQYRGNVRQTFGGRRMNIDQDYLDVEISYPPPPSPTPITYPAAATATRPYRLAFDTCQAPSLATMTAWRRSPYHSVGVYIGGVNLGCSQSHLTPGWVSAVSKQHWRLLPIYVGLQPSCLISNASPGIVKSGAQKMSLFNAAGEGKAAADDAIAKAQALGMLSGSALYLYLERYSGSSRTCRNTIASFVSAWTGELHRRGFLAGVNVNVRAGAQLLSNRYNRTSFGRPDALWITDRDWHRGLSHLPGLADNQWAVNQRAKQYRGPHNETHGGATLRVASDHVDAPAATVAYAEKVTSPGGLNARTGPGTGYRVATVYSHSTTVQAVCQTPGARIATTRVWDKLTNGRYVSDFYLSTPSKTGYSPPLPVCSYPYQVTDPQGLNMRSGPGTQYKVIAQLPFGSLAFTACQARGMRIGKTVVWDHVQAGHWVSDAFVATPNNKTFSRPLPRC
ncbi:MAG: DUF1906 domain-containing protein, partial [Actinobacteria bacterium]|nr:DUF1906 domain-containing protein [Actinomycetota bacterium]